MSRRDYSCSITMSDLLFNMLLAFVALFILAFAQMAVKQQNKTVEMKAEYLITVSWPNTFDDDVDVYIEDPQGHLVFFRRREDDLMHLDRDDQGQVYDFIDTPFGRVTYDQNREIITVRGTMPGEYVVNLHMYRRGSKNGTPCPVTVQMDQLTPFKTVGLKTVNLTRPGEEVTALRFTMSKDANNKMQIGKITDIFKSLTSAALYSQNPDRPPESTYNGNREVPPPTTDQQPPTIPE